MVPTILSVDIGTSSLKGGLFTTDGKVLHLSRTPVADPVSEDFLRFDPLKWERAFHHLLGHLPSVTIDAIVLSGQGPTLVPLDERGNPVFHALLWLDGREDPEFSGKSLFLSRVQWFRKNEGEAFKRTRHFLSCAEYLTYRLTGEMVTISPSPEFDAFYWDPVTLERLGLPSTLFPPLVRPSTLIGNVSAEGGSRFGLSGKTKVYAGGPDYLMSLLGTATTRVGRTLDRAGTSEGINTCVPGFVSQPGLRCLPHIVRGLYTLAGMLPSTGRFFEWFRDLTSQRDRPYDETMGGIYSLMPNLTKNPDRYPLYVPFGMEKEATDFDRGVFWGLGLVHGKREMGFAVVEAIGYAVRFLVEKLERAGFGIHELRLSGGQAKNPIWNQMKADLVGKPLLIPEVKDAELMGGVVAVATALGRFDTFDEAAQNLVKFERTVEPNLSLASVYGERYEQYKERRAKLSGRTRGGDPNALSRPGTV